jgi:hypothetical protein
MAKKTAVTARNNSAPKGQAAKSSSEAKAAANGAPARKEITHQMIAERAYEIYLSGGGGTPEENWYQAERELRGAQK